MIDKIRRRLQKEWRKSFLGRTPKEANPVRWGIIGLGYMAEVFSSTIDGNRNGVVHAVASRSLEKAKHFASNHGNCTAYGSYEAMVHDSTLKLDIVYIATPVKCHYECIKACLEAGLNVLCEKPITSNGDQLDELVELAKSKGCFLMEGMWMKCLPVFQKASDWINQGRIGKVDLLRIDFYKHEILREGFAIYNSSEDGGVMHDYGAYAIAFMEHFIGVPSKLNATCRKSSFGIDSDWQITASNNGITAMLNLSSDFKSLSKAAVIGSDGTIEWDSQFNRTNRITLFDKNGKVRESFQAKYKYEGFEFEVEEAQKAIRSKALESSLVPISGSQATMRIIDELIKTVNGHD